MSLRSYVASTSRTVLGGVVSSTRCSCLYAARELLASPRSKLAVRTLHSSAFRESGHNRWSKIRHRKGAADAQRSAVFSRLIKDVHAALRPPASPDPIANSRLALALAKAREGGVPKQAIEHCFTRAKAAAEGTGQSVVYEAVGPSGREALIIETITENPARTVQRLKELLHKNSCRIAPVAYLFEKKGIIAIAAGEDYTYDELFELAVEGGAEDVREVAGEEGERLYEVITAPSDLSNLTNALSDPVNASRYQIHSSDLSFIPINPLNVLAEGEEGDGIPEDKAEAVEKVVELLELEQDVVKVWTNLA